MEEGGRGEGVEGSRREATTNGFTFIPIKLKLSQIHFHLEF